MSAFLTSIIKSVAMQKTLHYVKSSGIIDGVVTLFSIVGVYYGWGILTDYGVDQLAATAMIRSIMVLLILLTTLRITLKAFNMLSGIKFSEWWDESSSSDKALYMSVRFMALAIAMAIVLG